MSSTSRAPRSASPPQNRPPDRRANIVHEVSSNDAEMSRLPTPGTPARQIRERPLPAPAPAPITARRRRIGGSAALCAGGHLISRVTHHRGERIEITSSARSRRRRCRTTAPDGRADDSGAGTERRREPSRNNGQRTPAECLTSPDSATAEAVGFRAGGVDSCVVFPDDAHSVASVRRRWRHHGVAVEVAALGQKCGGDLRGLPMDLPMNWVRNARQGPASSNTTWTVV